MYVKQTSNRKKSKELRTHHQNGEYRVEVESIYGYRDSGQIGGSFHNNDTNEEMGSIDIELNTDTNTRIDYMNKLIDAMLQKHEIFLILVNDIIIQVKTKK